MNPKLIKIATGIFLIILLGLGAFLLLDISSKKTSQNNLATSPEYDERDSYEAVISTSKKAEQWSSDARLYSCTGIAPDSTQFGLLGVDEGKFYTWDCIYYSKIKYSILTVQYKEGEVIVDPLKNSEKINEDDLRYENISYPKDYNRVLNSSVIYKSAVANGLDPQANYYSMYLGETEDYGYVWEIEEISTAGDKKNTPVTTYILDAYNAQLIKTTDQPVH